MKLFSVSKGTKVRVIEDGQEWYSDNIKNHETSENHAFELEEMCVDPVRTNGGNPASSAFDLNTVGGDWARAGWYGFRRDGWVILIPFNDVTVL